MPQTNLERWAAGESKEGIPTKTWNAFVDTAERVATMHAGVNPKLAEESTYFSVWAKHSLGVAVNYGEALGLFGTVHQINDGTGLNGRKPYLLASRAADPKSFGVVVKGSPGSGPNQVVDVAVQGYVWARVKMKSPLDSDCGYEESSVTLVSGVSGARIHWREKEDAALDEVIWCLVELGSAAGTTLSIGWLVDADLPAAKYDRTNKEFTPGVDALARVVPLKIDDETASPLVYVPEQDGGSDKKIEVVNLLQGGVDKDAVPHRLVTGFRRILDGTDTFFVVASQTYNVIHGQAESAVTSGTTTFTANTLSVVTGAGPTSANGTAATTVTVQNTFGFAIDSGGLLRAEQRDDGEWVCVQAVCPA